MHACRYSDASQNLVLMPPIPTLTPTLITPHTCPLALSCTRRYSDASQNLVLLAPTEEAWKKLATARNVSLRDLFKDTVMLERALGHHTVKGEGKELPYDMTECGGSDCGPTTPLRVEGTLICAVQSSHPPSLTPRPSTVPPLTPSTLPHRTSPQPTPPLAPLPFSPQPTPPFLIRPPSAHPTPPLPPSQARCC